ncbi:MAG: hypothetical protein WCO35_02955 [Candidatus Nomurabacteria bacterium]
MYSFNFDYIFNVVYNLLLAIRYAILFWILRINPSDYVMDHKYDSYDGLIARGWIGTAAPVPTQTQDVIYLGNISTDTGWWGWLRDHIFGKALPNANFTASQTDNSTWFRDLKFSIQNPVLAFCADIVSVIAFFAMMFLIYTMFVWFLRTTKSIREKNAKVKLEKRALKKEERQKAWFEENQKEIKNTEKEEFVLESYLEPESKSDYEEIFQKFEEERVLEIPEEIKILEEEHVDSYPAGILNLPIDESDLDVSERKIIAEVKEKENNLLLNYVAKNDLSKSKDRFIKIKTKDTIQEKKEIKKVEIKEETKKSENKINNPPISNLRQERLSEKEILEKEYRSREYKEKWNLIINYMEAKEEGLWRIGIIEADNLLADLLQDRGYEGNTLADKLKNASFGTIDLAWSAHKMRNRIAHDGSKFVLTDRMARNTLELFRSVFTEFKIFE